MTRRPHRRLVLPLLAALLLPAAFARAQSRIYYELSSNRVGDVTRIWSMNADGSNRVDLFPDGLGVPANYDPRLRGIAGPSRRLYPINPADPNSLSVAWWLAVAARSEFDASGEPVVDPTGAFLDLFAFAPDGQGGAVWRQLTDLEGTGLVLLADSLSLSNDGHDAFASIGLRDRSLIWDREDRQVALHPHHVVTLTAPFERATPIDPVAFEPVASLLLGGTLSNAFNGHHAWSPGNASLAYTLPYLKADGQTRRHLVVRSQSVPDRLLVNGDVVNIAFGSLQWSPDGTRLAFGDNYYGSHDIYAVNANSGALLKVVAQSNKGLDAFLHFFPIWSPDSRSLAVQRVFRDSNGSSLTTYDRSIVVVPSAGVRKTRDIVTILPTTWPTDVRPLSWR